MEAAEEGAEGAKGTAETSTMEEAEAEAEAAGGTSSRAARASSGEMVAEDSLGGMGSRVVGMDMDMEGEGVGAGEAKVEVAEALAAREELEVCSVCRCFECYVSVSASVSARE
jgi:hypothetical protein